MEILEEQNRGDQPRQVVAIERAEFFNGTTQVQIKGAV